MENWTLCIEDFGKIKKAEIEISPFTLFIGDNNSGKSYLMTLIYGLINYSNSNINMLNPKTSSKIYKTCANIFISLYDDVNKDSSEQKKEISLNEESFAALIAFLNEDIHNNKDELLLYLFNKKVDIGKLHLDVPYNPNWKISCEKKNIDIENGNPKYSFCLRKDDAKKSSATINVPESFLNPKSTGLFSIIVKMLTVSFFTLICGTQSEKTLYLPASRTGFMLTYKSLTNSSLDVAYSISPNDEKQNTKTTLTKPCVDFLQHINRVSDLNRKQNAKQSYKNVINLLEKKNH